MQYLDSLPRTHFSNSMNIEKWTANSCTDCQTYWQTYANQFMILWKLFLLLRSINYYLSITFQLICHILGLTMEFHYLLFDHQFIQAWILNTECRTKRISKLKSIIIFYSFLFFFHHIHFHSKTITQWEWQQQTGIFC